MIDPTTFSLMTAGGMLSGVLGGFVYQKYIRRVLTVAAIVSGVLGVSIVGIVLFGDTLQFETMNALYSLTAEKVIQLAVAFVGIYLGFGKGQGWAKRISKK